MRFGYRLRLTLAFAGLLLLGGTAATLVLAGRLTAELEGVVLRQASALARNLSLWGEEAVLTSDRVELARLVESMTASNDEVAYVYVEDARGRVLAHSFTAGFPAALREATTGRDRTLLRTELGSVLDVRAPVAKGRGGEFHVGYSRGRVLASVSYLKRLVWLIAIPIMALGILAIWIVSTYLTRPALKLAEVVRRFGSGDLRARVSEPFPGEFGTLGRAFNTMADNLEQQSEELRYLTAYNQNLIDNLGMGLYVVDGNLRVEYANDEIRREVGEVTGKDCREALCAGCALPADCAVLMAGETGQVQTRTCSRPEGAWIEQTAIPIRGGDGSPALIVTRRNITEAVQLRERMTQHEKLAAVGELAAVVAHEVNNPLDGMHALVQLVLGHPELPEPARRHLRMVDTGLSRMEMIVRRLLTFTADAAEPSERGTLPEQVERALAFVGQRLEAGGVEVVTDFEDGGTPVWIDPNTLPQVPINLALNAADAMPEGGRLEISTRRADGGVRLSFADEGPGVPEELRERVFRPFFTTKGQGKGTGLGLAISRRIVEGHGGTLTIRAGLKRGAVFELWLPQAEA